MDVYPAEPQLAACRDMRERGRDGSESLTAGGVGGFVAVVVAVEAVEVVAGPKPQECCCCPHFPASSGAYRSCRSGPESSWSQCQAL